MDKAQALYSFWAGFGLLAVDEQAAYDTTFDPPEQYITYEDAQDSFGYPVTIGADLWYRSMSWAEISQKAEQISNAIGMGGVFVPYDGGAIWITRGSPFSQRMDAETSNDVRRIHININAEFLSA